VKKNILTLNVQSRVLFVRPEIVSLALYYYSDALASSPSGHLLNVLKDTFILVLFE